VLYFKIMTSVNNDFWQHKKVFLTGHTGFKGGWLALWLQSMGAKVTGYALSPPTEPNFFTVADVALGLEQSIIADITDAKTLRSAMQKAEPDIVLHLAAQPLVRHSYIEPVATYQTNVIGTLNVLEAVRATSSVKVVVNITTDKCYENREWLWGYRENEALGGFDPYSSSKACAELVTAAYRQSFLQSAGVAVASARAGNVIGGGDWATDRLIPDFLRAIDAGQPLIIRSPDSIRPWQHVLEPLSGYLLLAEKLFADGEPYAEAWNFGSDDSDAKPVRWIIEQLVLLCHDLVWQCDTAPQPHEAHYLKLDSSKAKQRLAWQPRWQLATALEKTVAWHEAWRQGANMRVISLAQIDEYGRD
jgi:CDP-glucose 4,6-dehydratase